MQQNYSKVIPPCAESPGHEGIYRWEWQYSVTHATDGGQWSVSFTLPPPLELVRTWQREKSAPVRIQTLVIQSIACHFVTELFKFGIRP
jgi:hypothetical protein